MALRHTSVLRTTCIFLLVTPPPPPYTCAALHCATAAGHLPVVQLLCSPAEAVVASATADTAMPAVSADATCEGSGGRKPLCGREDFDKLGMTPLASAARGGYSAVVQYLVTEQVCVRHVCGVLWCLCTITCMFLYFFCSHY